LGTCQIKYIQGAFPAIEFIAAVTNTLAVSVGFCENAVKLEIAYQNLDNQPLTQMPYSFLETAPRQGIRTPTR